MNYIESVFMCLTAPLLFAVIGMHGRSKRLMIFLISGMAMSLLSAYISSFLAAAQGADVLHASIEISPLVEEIMKFLPVLFFILVMEASEVAIADSMMMTAVGFATFENVCFLMRNGADNLFYLSVRGFSTGAMHVMCAYIVALGLMHLWKTDWIRVLGTIGLLSVAASYHGVYNIMVAQTGAVAVIGYAIPLTTAFVALVLRGKLQSGRLQNPHGRIAEGRKEEFSEEK